ncbi:MAG TPA: hypothetical protein VN238_17340 [Solirubrobacteraceae bacterium]|nr:hypothetical protein [Solirubrobacteraceae bacterium]
MATAAAAGTLAPAASAKLASSYDLVGTLGSSYVVPFSEVDLRPATTLGTIGGAPAFTQDAALPSPRKDVADFAAGQGFTVSGVGILDPAEHAIALSFRLDDVDPDAAPGTVVPVLSFDAGASGAGLAVVDGRLAWRTAGGVSTPVGSALADDQWVNAVVSRGKTSLTVAGAGGSTVVSGTGAAAAWFEEAQLFGPGSGAGQLSRVRTWDGGLSADDIATVAGDDAVDATAPSLYVDDGGAYEEDGVTWFDAAHWLGGSSFDGGSAPVQVQWTVRTGGCAGTVATSGTMEVERILASSLGANSGFDWGIDLSGLNDGADYTFCLTVTDRRGNSASGSKDFRLDALAPTLSIESPAVETTDRTVVFAGGMGLAERDRGSVSVAVWRGSTIPTYGDPDYETRRLGDLVGTGSDDSGDSWEIRVTKDGQPVGEFAPGTYIVEARQCDKVGNCSIVERVFKVLGSAEAAQTPGATTPAPAQQQQQPQPAAPRQPVVPVPSAREVAGRLLESVIGTLRGSRPSSLLAPRTLKVPVAAPGRVQVVVFAGSAPKTVVAYGAAARKTAVPSNAIALGSAGVAKAGTANVRLKPTKRAGRLVRGKRSVRVTVRTIVVPAAGGTPVASDRALTLRR